MLHAEKIKEVIYASLSAGNLFLGIYSSISSGGGFIGSLKPNVEPSPSFELTKTCPWWCFSTVTLTKCNPKPVPLTVWVAFSHL